MRLKFIFPVLALPLLLSACMNLPSAATSEPATTPTGAQCNASPAQFAVGRITNAALELEAKNRAGAKTVRVLRPNQVMTLEFNTERLNLAVDQTGRVTRVNCG